MNTKIPTNNNGGQAPKVLLADLDFRRSGTTSIARSEDEIKQLFGYHPLHIKSGKGFKMFMDVLGKRVDKPITYGVDTVFELSPNFKDIDYFVLDTLSGLHSFVTDEIRGAKSTMMQQDWGRLGHTMASYLIDISNLPCNVVVTAHTKFKDDLDLGRRIESPALSGQTGEQLSKYFDNVMYANVETEKQGKRIYSWQAAPSESRDCRCLPAVTESALQNKGFLPQDFVNLTNLIKQDTVEPTKTLILGRAGAGKTYSLRTLADMRI